MTALRPNSYRVFADPSHRISVLIILALALLTNWVTIRLRRLPIAAPGKRCARTKSPAAHSASTRQPTNSRRSRPGAISAFRRRIPSRRDGSSAEILHLPGIGAGAAIVVLMRVAAGDFVLAQRFQARPIGRRRSRSSPFGEQRQRQDDVEQKYDAMVSAKTRYRVFGRRIVIAASTECQERRSRNAANAVSVRRSALPVE